MQRIETDLFLFRFFSCLVATAKSNQTIFGLVVAMPNHSRHLFSTDLVASSLVWCNQFGFATGIGAILNGSIINQNPFKNGLLYFLLFLFHSFYIHWPFDSLTMALALAMARITLATMFLLLFYLLLYAVALERKIRKYHKSTSISGLYF